jgi:hypothetical protein
VQGGPGPGAGPWPYGPAPEPPKKSRTGLIAALSIGGVIVVLGGIAAAAGMSSGGGKKSSVAASTPASSASASPSAGSTDVPHTVTIPHSFSGYTRTTGSVADRAAKTIRKEMDRANSKYAAIYAKAKIAIYTERQAAYRPLFFLGLSASDSPEIGAEFRSSTPSTEVDSVFMGMGVTDAKDYPAGPLGSVLRCGTTPTGAGTACAWADSSMLGVVITPQTSGVKALAGTTLDLRNAAEH